jgi:hypothetical protein
MLNTLIESEASVLAIVVTLSLVAVQLASSATTRVIEIFRKSPNLWILISIYIFSITYGITVLKCINMNNPLIIKDIEWHISFVYFLSIFAFTALVPYIWSMLQLMNPEKVINKLGNELNKDSILGSYKENKPFPNEPIQPLIDMMNNAQLHYQVGTFRNGIKVIENGIINILEEGIDQDEESKLSNYLLVDHLDRVARIAIKNENEVASTELVKSLFRINQISSKQKNHILSGNISSLIGDVGELAAKNGMKYPASTTLVYLGLLGKESIKEQERYNSYIILSSIKKIYQESITQNSEYATFMLGFLPGVVENLVNANNSNNLQLTELLINTFQEIKNLLDNKQFQKNNFAYLVKVINNLKN